MKDGEYKEDFVDNCPQPLINNEKIRRLIIEKNEHDAKPVLNDIKKLGYSFDRIMDIILLGKEKYSEVVPILLKWLPAVSNLDVKESIVRSLTVKWAKPIAAFPLINEYRTIKDEQNCDIKWAIGNALYIVSDDSVYEDVVELLLDRSNGTSRQMLAMSLGKMKNPGASDVLLSLLDDETIYGHVIAGLGLHGVPKARSAIEPFLTHPKTWIRKEARLAITRIDRAAEKKKQKTAFS